MTDSDFGFEVLDARAEPYAAVPTIMLRTRITEHTGATCPSMRIHIEPQRRRYEHGGGAARRDSESQCWGSRTVLWTQRRRPSRRSRAESTSDDVHVRLEISSRSSCIRSDGGEVPLRLLLSAFTRNEAERRPSPGA
jgi:hypothetical protein